MSRVCVDSGFLIGLYDERDSYHRLAEQHFSTYIGPRVNQLLVPWPILYESVSTRMVSRGSRVALLEKDWKRLEAERRLVMLDDREFRQNAMEECLAEAWKTPARYRALSLTDRVLRSLLSEIRVDVFITFNEEDFADVCRRRGQTLVGKQSGDSLSHGS